MIRFACPGCSATFTVDGEKAGKTGKCPKCQTQFVIPAGDAMVVPAPPAEAPPPLPPAAPVEIDPCPKCQTRLSVSASDVGLDVECPYCKTVFKAAKGGGPRPPGPPPAPPTLSADGDRPRSKRRADDEDDDRPRSRRRRDDEEDEDDRPSRRRRDEDDDEDEDRPSRRKRSRRRSTDESKRIVAGVLAILLGGFGVHKFYLGYTNAGIIMLVLCLCTGLTGIIGLVEGIIYLTKTDEDFIETYQTNQKEWF